MNYSIIDMETDGLLDTVTKIHCLSVKRYRGDRSLSFTLTNYDDMRLFFQQEEIIIGHNIYRFDKRVAEKILGIVVSCRIIDTLALSWYLYPKREEHGLGVWGDDLGIEKPAIDDWHKLDLEYYIFRCEEDVRINDSLFNLMLNYLNVLYNYDGEQIKRIIGYLMFKMNCALEQEEMRWKLDIDKCRANLVFLGQELESKKEALRQIMPKVKKYKKCTRPKTLYKKDGTLSSHGQNWINNLRTIGLPDYHLGDIKVVCGEEEPNPNSHAQLKSWLFSLGWVPETFNYVKDKKEDGGYELRKIPQINTKDDGICDSVKKLYTNSPELEHLESYFVISHRIGILNGFLERKDSEGFLQAQVKGFTNTLRFQHTTIVNLPTVVKAYGQYCRECLIAPSSEYILCGSDLSGLEESTKHHYMYKYDPEYVKEIRQPGFDPHLDIAVEAGLITREDVKFYKEYNKDTATPEEKARYAAIKDIRINKAKKANFGAVYGAGAPKIALTAGIALNEASILHKAFWRRNNSVKKVANSCVVKRIGDQMWLFNPVSQFWYSLREEKDKFSTLNQGTGVYCMDTWVRHVRKQEIKLCGQFHDEIIFPLLNTEEAKQEATNKLTNAINWTNEELQLNITLGISIDFGDNYAAIH